MFQPYKHGNCIKCHEMVWHTITLPYMLDAFRHGLVQTVKSEIALLLLYKHRRCLQLKIVTNKNVHRTKNYKTCLTKLLMPRFKPCLQAFILNEKWVKHILNIVYLLLIFFLKYSKYWLNTLIYHGYLSRQMIRPTTLKINPETPEGKFRCKSRKQIFHSFTLKVSFGTFHH